MPPDTDTSEIPEMRPFVIVNHETNENELTAALWDESRSCWTTNDGRSFPDPSLEGSPEDAPDIVVATQAPGPLVDLEEKILGGGRDE